MSVEVSLGTKFGMRIDLTLLHSRTLVALVTELLCAFDHSSNAFAVAQVASPNRLPFGSIFHAIEMCGTSVK